MTYALQLQRIDKNPGLLPVKEGHALIQTDKWTIIKTIDLTGLYDDLTFNTNKYNDFVKLIDTDKPYPFEFLGIKIQVEYLHSITVEKYKQLIPTQRFKRGLINPLGSLIKVITGNLDHSDAIRYDKLISDANGKSILLEKKITIISKMLDNFINSTETLHNNTLILDERLRRVEIMAKEIATKENNAIYSASILGLFNMFICNFRTIYIKLNEIETALAFSRVSVLHQSIVNSTELLYLLQAIAETDNLMYPVNLYNLVKLEQTIVVKSYIKGNQITFLMEVPLTDNITYNYFKIYSLPVTNYHHKNGTFLIIPEHPFVLAKGMKYRPVVKPCKEIATDRQFLCAEENLAAHSETTCVEELMRFDTDPHHCTPVSVEIEDLRTQQISYNSWIVYSKDDAVLFSKCSTDETRETLQGTYILTLEEGCEVLVKNLHLRPHRTLAGGFNYKVTPIINLPKFHPLNASLKVIPMKNINLDETRQLSQVLKAYSEINSESGKVNFVNESYNIETLMIYIVLALIIMFILYKYRLSFISLRNCKSSKSDNSFALEEGEVMHPAPGRVVIINADTPSPGC